MADNTPLLETNDDDEHFMLAFVGVVLWKILQKIAIFCVAFVAIWSLTSPTVTMICGALTIATYCIYTFWDHLRLRYQITIVAIVAVACILAPCFALAWLWIKFGMAFFMVLCLIVITGLLVAIIDDRHQKKLKKKANEHPSTIT